MKILVCGGRDYTDYERIKRELDLYRGVVTCVIHGAARGADRLGGQVAKEMGIEVEVYPANWTRFGRRAGYIRNKQMAEQGKPNLVLAFGGGAGTNMMVRIAKDANIPVMEIDR